MSILSKITDAMQVVLSETESRSVFILCRYCNGLKGEYVRKADC